MGRVRTCTHDRTEINSSGHCRACQRAKRSTPEYRARRRQYKRTPGGLASIRRDAGIQDPERYDELLVAAGGACEICGTTDFGSKIPHLDHDHDTKMSRGILCTKCNTGLGLFQDSPAILERAAKYLWRKWLESLK